MERDNNTIPTRPEFSRTAMLLGTEAVEHLDKAHVAVFGIGGVGSFAAEALARAGIGRMTIVDADIVDVTNINRQLIALQSTVGRSKVQVMAERIADIRPDLKVTVLQIFFDDHNADTFDFRSYDYVVDAIDTGPSKIALICHAKAAGVPVISSMGAGNKLDPTRFEVADIADTSVCPLARIVRRELKKRGVQGVKTVYSREEPILRASEMPCPTVEADFTDTSVRLPRRAPGSVSFVPSAVGLTIASVVVRDIITMTDEKN